MFRTKCKEHDHSEFYQFLQMEPTHKNSDCYFFYYSTCTKGDNCTFRHEPSALGCEVICSYWQQGNCLNEHCNFRHMELKKNRKSIPCFWETQRGGCKKPHCPFLHTSGRPAANPDAANPIKTAEVTTKPVTQEWSNRPDDGKYDGSGTESDQGRGSSEAGSFIGSPAVDPLIVNFDEESDSESAPSPVKAHAARVPYCKTYEEIRLEEIQAESAAYYSYEPDDYLGSAGGGKEKRVTSVRAARRMVSLYSREKPASATSAAAAAATATSTANAASTAGETSASSDFTILTLDEIRRRKAAAQQLANSKETGSSSSGAATTTTTTGARIPQRRKETAVETGPKDSGDFLRDAIKTLAELKAANSTKSALPQPPPPPPPPISRKRSLESAELYANDEDTEASRGSNKISKVPPVRLRRSPKRFARNERIAEATSATTTTSDEKTSLGLESTDTRAEEIEVRLCDSSTSDDAQTPTVATSAAATTRDVGAGTAAEPANPDELELEQLCDTNLSANDDDDDEYLTSVDPASEHILKDIDALLTEKPTV